MGWRDVMLIERSELTSGSTWHAAGGFHTLNADTNMAALQGCTIRLYREPTAHRAEVLQPTGRSPIPRTLVLPHPVSLQQFPLTENS